MKPIGSIKFSLVFEKQWWVGIFERTDDAGYSVAREIFGAEPTDPELYEFILKNQHTLTFTKPLDDSKPVLKKTNPKRMMREARQHQRKALNVSKAQDALRLEIEKNKLEKKSVSSAEKERIKQFKFELKQKKRKEKHQGH